MRECSFNFSLLHCAVNLCYSKRSRHRMSSKRDVHYYPQDHSQRNGPWASSTLGLQMRSNWNWVDTHLDLKAPPTGCNTKRRHTKSAIVYSNKVLEIPLKQSDIVTRVREIEIPFSCFYSNSRVATAVGMKPKNRKLVFSERGKGNFTVVLELFHSKRYWS